MKIGDNRGSIKAEGLTLFVLAENAPKARKVAPKAPENAFKAPERPPKVAEDVLCTDSAQDRA